jgi:hypothetical protein
MKVEGGAEGGAAAAAESARRHSLGDEGGVDAAGRAFWRSVGINPTEHALVRFCLFLLIQLDIPSCCHV